MRNLQTFHQDKGTWCEIKFLKLLGIVHTDVLQAAWQILKTIGEAA